MKKIVLKKQESLPNRQRIGYKINYSNELNPAQYEAVMHGEGPALVIAGAGTGKTRTLIYRVARLIEDGIPSESILLLTFTRKSAAEMLRRAAIMLDGRCEKVSGGTFHSFALNILRKYAKKINYDTNFTVLDSGDVEDTINLLRSRLNFDKTKKRFPRKDTLARIFNLSINRCVGPEDIIMKDYPSFVDDIDDITNLFIDFNDYKRRHNLMDYDDMLLNLLILCQKHEDTKRDLNAFYNFILVDEYQDTNRLQHEIILQLAGRKQNVMAVGDDAQSIYSFRGAEYQNIMTFPESYNNCIIYKIEENYRSTQPILDLTNEIISYSPIKYEKELFTRKTEGDLPKIISAENERQQSLFVVQQVLELREMGYKLDDMAVLFRSGFLSFDLEIELNKANIPYQKFGGLKFVETAHIKDMLAYMKVLVNPKDAVSWHRVLLLEPGIGSKTAERVIDNIMHDYVSVKASLDSLDQKAGSTSSLFKMIRQISGEKMSIVEKTSRIADYYGPIMKTKYDDWQKRQKDIDMFLSISERYKSINDLLSDVAIVPPIESVVDMEAESKEEEYLTLSTVHSAKGLEWRAIFLIWALDGRFPSSRSAESMDSLEEERRLFYVACTRAKDQLYISYPINIYDRTEGVVLYKPSRFIRDIDESIADRFIIDTEGEEE
jgi:DNA helicase-2/ATP-dependent DNA helicase PcrA